MEASHSGQPRHSKYHPPSQSLEWQSALCPFSFPSLTLLPSLHLSVIGLHSLSIISFIFSISPPWRSHQIHRLSGSIFKHTPLPFPADCALCSEVPQNYISVPLCKLFKFFVCLFSYLLKSFCLCLLSICQSRGIVHGQSSYCGGLTPG